MGGGTARAASGAAVGGGERVALLAGLGNLHERILVRVEELHLLVFVQGEV